MPDLARKAGIAPSTWYDIENGNQNSSTKLHSIAKALGVTADYLETGRNQAAGVGEQRGTYRVREQLTDDEHDFALAWRQVDEPVKTQIFLMVEGLVAQQIKDERKRKSDAKKGDDQHGERSKN